MRGKQQLQLLAASSLPLISAIHRRCQKSQEKAETQERDFTLGVEKLAVLTGTNFVDDVGLEVDVERAGHVFAGTRFGEKGAESVILKSKFVVNPTSALTGSADLGVLRVKQTPIGRETVLERVLNDRKSENRKVPRSITTYKAPSKRYPTGHRLGPAMFAFRRIAADWTCRNNVRRGSR
jgi:hypothetical protein